MKVEIVTITPEMAEEMLTHNYEGNRHVRTSYVSQLAHVMSAGRYVSENGQTIVFGEDDGVLYDGQHRLMAIVESRCAQTVIVVWIVNGKEAYKTIDNGTKRNAADFIKLPSRGDCANVSKVMACVEWGESPLLSCLQGKFAAREQVDRGLIVSYAEQNGEAVLTAVRKGGTMRDAIGCGARTIYATFISIVKYCDMDAFRDEFTNEFVMAAPTSPTVIALKTLIMKSNLKQNGLEKKWLISTLLDAYHHFCEMDNSTMFNKQAQRINQYQKLMQQKRDELRGKGGEA